MASDYFKKWVKEHPLRIRAHKLKWYYRNRRTINMLFTKPTGIEDDEADEYLLKHAQGEKWAED